MAKILKYNVEWKGLWCLLSMSDGQWHARAFQGTSSAVKSYIALLEAWECSEILYCTLGSAVKSYIALLEAWECNITFHCTDTTYIFDHMTLNQPMGVEKAHLVYNKKTGIALYHRNVILQYPFHFFRNTV